MEQLIGCDAHEKFSVLSSIDKKGMWDGLFGHNREIFRKFRPELPAGYDWIVDEMEQAGHQPRLAHALRAKRRMQGRPKTKREGCPRPGRAARQWNPAGRLDFPGRIRRPAGVAGLGHVSIADARPNEEPHSGSAAAVQPDGRLRGFVRRRRPRESADWKKKRNRSRDVKLRLACAGIAQLVEHLICNQRVGGSIPSAGSIESKT
jgi:hypothetical protein